MDKLSSNLLNSLLRYNSDIVICLAMDFTITLLNERGENFYHWSPQDVLGKNFLELCKTFNYTSPINSNFFDNPVLFNINLDTQNSTGKQCNINWVVSPLVSTQGNIYGAMIIGKNIELKKNNIAYYLNGIINAIPGCLYWKDCNGRYLGCNELTAKLAGLSSPYEVAGKTDWELWGEQADQLIQNDEQVITSGKTILVEEKLKDSEGRWVYFTGVKMPLRDENDQIIGIIGNSLDITELKKTQAELKESKELAEAANKAKTEFLENMRHDIRTPLTGITGFASIIAEESKDPKIKEYVANLVASSYALNDLLNEILEVIRIGSNEIPILKKKFNLKNKLTEVIKLTNARALEKKLSLLLEYDDRIPAFLIGDSTRIHRIVLELVTNALNFTDQGWVKLSAHLEKEIADKIVLRIEAEDTGIGIPPEKRQEVFLHFKRLIPSYAGIYKGAGLGLSIIKQFVEDLDGEIYIEAREEKGTRFIVVLPLKKSLIQNELGVDEDVLSHIKNIPALSYSVKEANTQSKTQQSKSCILLIEDQPISAKVVIALLTQLDCQIDLAQKGADAVKMFQERPYHLIFMDIGLPDFDGYEVAKRIRLLEQDDSHIPIIALTAHVDEENKQHCIDVGMNAVLSKPLTKEKAEDILNAFIPYREKESRQSISEEIQEVIQEGPAININKLSKLYSDKKEINEILNLIIESYPEDLAALNESYNKNDWASLNFIVHKLKGGASYYGGDRVMKLCSQLEEAAKGNELEKISELYSKVTFELKTIVEEAKRLINSEDYKLSDEDKGNL